MSKPNLYLLVGLPGSGKTTWVKNQFWADSCEIISTDYYIEQYAFAQNKKQHDIFLEYMPTAVQKMLEHVEKAKKLRRNIIWEQTSTTVVSRVKKLRLLPDYRAHAIVMPQLSDMELQRRLASRPNKIIPRDVISSMIENYEEPSLVEGFDEIWNITQ